MGKQLQKAAADSGKSASTDADSLPAAGGFRKPSKSRCRWREVSVN